MNAGASVITEEGAFLRTKIAGFNETNGKATCIFCQAVYSPSDKTKDKSKYRVVSGKIKEHFAGSCKIKNEDGKFYRSRDAIKALCDALLLETRDYDPANSFGNRQHQNVNGEDSKDEDSKDEDSEDEDSEDEDAKKKKTLTVVKCPCGEEFKRKLELDSVRKHLLNCTVFTQFFPSFLQLKSIQSNTQLEGVTQVEPCSNGDHRFNAECTLYYHEDLSVPITFVEQFIHTSITYYGKASKSKGHSLRNCFNTRKRDHEQSGALKSTERMIPVLQGPKKSIEFLETLCQLASAKGCSVKNVKVEVSAIHGRTAEEVKAGYSLVINALRDRYGKREQETFEAGNLLNNRQAFVDQKQNELDLYKGRMLERISTEGNIDVEPSSDISELQDSDMPVGTNANRKRELQFDAGLVGKKSRIEKK